jgi:hypothetical protein
MKSTVVWDVTQYNLVEFTDVSKERQGWRVREASNKQSDCWFLLLSWLTLGL